MTACSSRRRSFSSRQGRPLDQRKRLLVVIAGLALAAGCRSATTGGHVSASTTTSAAGSTRASSSTSSLTTGSTSSASPPPSTGPCGTLSTPPSYYHVVWVWLENRSYGKIIGNSQAPYINALASECGLATNYHNITHPSLPNYVGATSGLGLATLKNFTSDCSPSKLCSTAAPSIFGQGETWKAYEESMPSNCFQSSSGEYAAKHNPPPYFSTLSGCPSFDVPYSQLRTDLNDNALPAFSFVTPNVIDDMHDGSIGQGDSWLSATLPSILNSSEYQGGSTAVFITWDEGSGGGDGEDCTTNTTDPSCRVATVVISPSTMAGSKSATLFNHYSLLGTAEQLLSLPALGQASSYPTMTSAFNL